MAIVPNRLEPEELRTLGLISRVVEVGRLAVGQTLPRRERWSISVWEG